MERLLKEYRQNQELVRRIGSHYYQIIYPVQLRHHEKMGISTREVGAQKFPARGHQESNYPGSGRGRSRVGVTSEKLEKLLKFLVVLFLDWKTFPSNVFTYQSF